MSRTFLLSESDVISAAQLHAPRRRNLMAPVCLVLFLLWLSGWQDFIALGVTASVLLMIGWFYPKLIAGQARHVYRENPTFRNPQELEWDDSGINHKTVHVRAWTDWAAFVDFKENDRVILLYHSKYAYVPVPKAVFGSDVELDEFRKHLRRPAVNDHGAADRQRRMQEWN